MAPPPWAANVEFLAQNLDLASPRTVGANSGFTRVPGAKKIIFFKVVPRPLGMLKQVFLGRFEPVVARFGPWKIPKCLENGPFWDQQWVKNGSKTHFSENDPGPFMMLKQVVLAHLEPVATRLGSWNIPKCLEMGPFWDQKWVQNGSKTRFSKSDPGPFGMLKQVFLAHFEPVLTEFSPFHHMYAPLCALRTYLRAVWWSHLELGEGCRLEDIYIYIYIYIYGTTCNAPLPPRDPPAGGWLGLGTPPPIFGSRNSKKEELEPFGTVVGCYDPSKLLKIGISYRVTSSPKIASKS